MSADQKEAYTAEELEKCPLSQYTLAEAECQEMRDAFSRLLVRMKTLKPKVRFPRRSSAAYLDKHMQRFCNEVRRLAAEFDQSQKSK